MKSTEEIIKNHVLWSLGGGLIPFPILDFIAVTSIQLDMIKDLCSVYRVNYDKNQGKNLVSALVGTSLASIGASFVKAIPGIGTLLGGVSMSIMSGAATYALGNVFATHFARGGTLDNLSVNDFRVFYNEKMEEGKTRAKEWKAEEEAEKKAGNITREKLMTELEKLEKLKAAGILSQSEYDNMRRKLLDRFVR